MAKFFIVVNTWDGAESRDILISVKGKNKESILHDLELLVEDHCETDGLSGQYHLFHGTWIDITFFFSRDFENRNRYSFVKPQIYTLEEYWEKNRVTSKPT